MLHFCIYRVALLTLSLNEVQKSKGKTMRIGEAGLKTRQEQNKVRENILRTMRRNSATSRLPLYTSSVRAGFPSPAEGDIEDFLDLNEHLINHPAATFIVKASGDSMSDVGIQSGDLLIVDRSLEAIHGKIVIAAINGELTVKRLSKLNGRVKLLPENNKYPAIDITDEQDVVIWGVVKHVIHTLG